MATIQHASRGARLVCVQPSACLRCGSFRQPRQPRGEPGLQLIKLGIQTRSGTSGRSSSDSVHAKPQLSPDTSNQGSNEPEEPEDNSIPVRMALAFINFYRTALSPLMQPSCRYQPTCSIYALEAYKRYGAWRGGVLTAWRLLRCSPFGSSGYDPPQWPPPGLSRVYGEGSWQYAPEVTVALAVTLLTYGASILWHEVEDIL
mmetsp:Transcript_4526/g.7675  ORF Transcript_4526/g.7675 Transcript_4526/m.7675 type:complete len:202 (+) Transcript_4526:63-668(+)